MGGEEECNGMVLGQRDMVKLEKDYYYDEMINLFKYCCIFIGMALIGFVVYNKYFL